MDSRLPLPFDACLAFIRPVTTTTSSICHRRPWSQLSLPEPLVVRMVQTEKRLNDLDIILPPPPKPAANYVPVRASGNLLYLSGHIPIESDGMTLITGKIGKGAKDLDHGYRAARQVGLNLIATLKEELGDLDRVEKIVKLFGIVQSTEDFKEQHLCMNGVSDVLAEVFGDRGVHARSAIGTNCLPLDVSVEVEAIVMVKPEE